MVSIPLPQANAIIQDLNLLKIVLEGRSIDAELIALLKERLGLEQAINVSYVETIRLLNETIDSMGEKEEKGFAKFIRDLGKYALGALIGAAGALIIVATN